MIDFGTPIEDEHVKRLCEYFGYGAVMESAARQWKAKDPIGAKTVGDCCGAPSIPTGPELRERMINIIFEETAAGRNDTEDAADRILSLLPATPLDRVYVEGIDDGPDGRTVCKGYRTPDGVTHITSIEGPDKEDVSARRGPSALDDSCNTCSGKPWDVLSKGYGGKCPSCGAVAAPSREDYNPKAPCKHTEIIVRMGIPQCSNCGATMSTPELSGSPKGEPSESLHDPLDMQRKPENVSTSPSLELREALTEAMDLLENWPLPKMGNPLREELAADRKALRERVRAISPQGSEAPAPGARPEAHPGNKPIPPHQMFPDSFGQEGPSHG